MFQDEGRFGLIEDPRRCWSPPGHRPECRAQVVREYTYAFCAVSPQDGVLDSLVFPTVNSEVMSIFLAEISSRHPDEYIVMLLDRAGWHISRSLEIPENIYLEYLPPYSPELNPAEHIWEELREKWFHNRVFKNLLSIEDQLCIALKNMEDNKEAIKKLTGFPWILDVNLNAI